MSGDPARHRQQPSSSLSRPRCAATPSPPGADNELALTNWRCCLEAGDSIAHFALGYTLYELGRYHEAYRQLRYYAQIAPASAWNWCWLGKAAQAIGETGEARAAYEKACEIEVAAGEDAEETDAAALVVGLDGG